MKMSHSRNTSLASTQGSPKLAQSPAGALNAGIKKKFACTHPDCGKAFSRSEHLHRHALNHKDGTSTCMRCSAHFRRRDLLDRHMARHKEKDDEAGGEGLGVLATRKRLWRDETGKIVNARRPSCINVGHLTKLSIDTSGAAAQPIKRRASNARERKPRSKAALPSPPMSSLSSQTRSASPHNHIGPAMAQAPAPAYVATSPVKAPIHIKTEGAPHLDPWLTADHGPPLPLPSPPMSEASLASATHSHPSHHHPPSHEPPLYEEPHHSSWPILHPANDASSEHHGHPRNQPPYLQPSAQHWTPSAHQPFQTFMGSAGSHEHPQEYPAPEEEMGIFKPEIGLSQSLGTASNMGLSMYDWHSGQSTWTNGGGGMMSRVREERYESPANTTEKREAEPHTWNTYHHHAPSPVYTGRSFLRC